MAVDWQLQGCCDTRDIVFLCCYVGYSLFTMFLMESVVVKPMKLIAIFIHEMGHASAAWLTGGTIQKIEVYQNEGGVAHFGGGFRPAVIPAGYVGVSFWGGVFVALSGSRIGATIAASLFMFSLLVCLKFSPNTLLIWLCVGFILITLTATLIEWLVFNPILEYVTLFFGVFIGWYGIMDIWDDTIARVVDASDAGACHQMWRCCAPRCVGVQFLLCAILCQIAGLYFAMVSLMKEDQDVNE
jgi:Peptidase M50B-like